MRKSHFDSLRPFIVGRTHLGVSDPLVAEDEVLAFSEALGDGQPDISEGRWCVLEDLHLLATDDSVGDLVHLTWGGEDLVAFFEGPLGRRDLGVRKSRRRDVGRV